MKTFRFLLILFFFSFSCLALPAASLASADEGAQKTLDGLNEAVKGGQKPSGYFNE